MCSFLCGPSLIDKIYAIVSSNNALNICECTAMTDAALLVLQNAADLESIHVRGLCGEICPASSRDAYQAVSIKTEVPSDAEVEEDPLAIPFSGIKAEPEVSCVPVRGIP
jgi:hypothetical protein